MSKTATSVYINVLSLNFKSHPTRFQLNKISKKSGWKKLYKFLNNRLDLNVIKYAFQKNNLGLTESAP